MEGGDPKLLCHSNCSVTSPLVGLLFTLHIFLSSLTKIEQKLYSVTQMSQRKQKSKEEKVWRRRACLSDDHSPRQAEPSGAISCPSGHTHWKLPSVFTQSPPRHNRGFLSHSSISDNGRTHRCTVHTQTQVEKFSVRVQSIQIFVSSQFPMNPTGQINSKLCFQLAYLQIRFTFVQQFNCDLIEVVGLTFRKHFVFILVYITLWLAAMLITKIDRNKNKICKKGFYLLYIFVSQVSQPSQYQQLMIATMPILFPV